MGGRNLLVLGQESRLTVAKSKAQQPAVEFEVQGQLGLSYLQTEKRWAQRLSSRCSLDAKDCHPQQRLWNEAQGYLCEHGAWSRKHWKYIF